MEVNYEEKITTLKQYLVTNQQMSSVFMYSNSVSGGEQLGSLQLLTLP